MFKTDSKRRSFSLNLSLGNKKGLFVGELAITEVVGRVWSRVLREILRNVWERCHSGVSISSSYNRSQQDALFLNFILVNSLTCIGQTYCPSSGVLILYSQQMVYVVNLCDCLLAKSGS